MLQVKSAVTSLSLDWLAVARYVLLARELDELEERELVPTRQTDPRRMVKYQFSAEGHELAQVLLALALDHAHDAANVYYRSRPFMLASGLTAEEALAAGMARTGSPNEGRDVGVTFNLPRRERAVILPMSGDVGTQFTPAAGWAQAIRYRSRVMGESEWEASIAVALGGDGSVASNGFWAALNIVTTLRLPMLFFIEDNGYGISVPAALQTPGGNIAANLASFHHLKILDGDGWDPQDAADKITRAVAYVRGGEGPALLRLRVPRLKGHTFGEDPRAYKSERLIIEESKNDPLPRLQALIVNLYSANEWDALVKDVRAELVTARRNAERHPEPDPATVTRDVFFENVAPAHGGLRPENVLMPRGSATAQPSGTRINLLEGIRRTLEHELKINPRVLVFGEDVGPRGGVHRATVGLQREFGEGRVFDTSLSEEGIIGRAQGMALAGLLPVPEIQFRKYADPAHEQINDIGTLRWRTAGKFAVPMVVRIPVGFARRPFGDLGDPWHSVTGEAIYAHTLGWRLAFPSNAQDAVGLLRTALRGDDPTLFFEHRALLDAESARRPYPGDDYCLPFGQAAIVREGDELTAVTWGEFVYRCLEAARAFDSRVEVIDLRTITPWDKATVLASVKKTGKVMIVHEDTRTGGFGAEIAGVIAREAFTDLDAPIERVAAADCPVPFNVGLMNAMLPSVETIRIRMKRLLDY